ncbi:unnamed protein product [Bursaphelenchus okinawaensis]|uniref:Uncharacterized protein n=1 Tax=Bursaphelenchus okinawaensis TaxID=465554 RepID=A0A811JQX7_9BILA|nr:unnamed protein product [Bursaphelenchus okinawaensis]CAG9078694.1 unnamed protein product [Bursaphelenchus okinawaensis]
MGFLKAYTAISTLSILAVDDRTQLCVDFYTFRFEGETAIASKYVNCPGNSTVEADFAGTPIETFTLVSSGRDPQFLNVEFQFNQHESDVFQAGFSPGYMFYQNCRTLESQYCEISDCMRRKLNFGSLKICGLTFGQTSEGLIWEDKDQCLKLVVDEQYVGSMKAEPCPNVDKVMFTMVSNFFLFLDGFEKLKPLTQGDLSDAQVDTTLALLYLQEKPPTATTEETTITTTVKEVSKVTDKEPEPDSSLPPWQMGLIGGIIAAMVVLVLAGVYWYLKKKGKNNPPPRLESPSDTLVTDTLNAKSEKVSKKPEKTDSNRSISKKKEFEISRKHPIAI